MISAEFAIITPVPSIVRSRALASTMRKRMLRLRW